MWAALYSLHYVSYHNNRWVVRVGSPRMTLASFLLMTFYGPVDAILYGNWIARPPSFRNLVTTKDTCRCLSLTTQICQCSAVDQVLPVTEPVSFHGLTTVSATEASLLPDPEYGMLYRQNSDMISALNSLGANWSRICLSRTLNHGALWHIDSLRLRNILTYLLTYFWQSAN